MEDRPRPEVRLSDADREYAASRVALAHADGRISLDELDERLRVVYRARTVGDLNPALADLPTDRERRMLSGKSHLAHRDGDTVDLAPRSAGLVREGRWHVPRRLVVRELAWRPDERGPVVLDFRTAVIPHREVEIGLWVGGAVQLVLPRGGTADLSGVRAPGPAAPSSVPSKPAPPAMHLVVHGVAVRRRAVRVSYRRLPRWWISMIM